MPASNKFIHRALIQRNTVLKTNTDDYGNDPQDVWTTLYAALHCYCWYYRRADKLFEGKRAELTQTQLILPRFTDITANDRIFSVSDRKGTVLEPDVKRIEHLARRSDHILLRLVAVT